MSAHHGTPIAGCCCASVSPQASPPKLSPRRRWPGRRPRDGNDTAQIFWLKMPARWKEQAREHLHTGVIATFGARTKLERRIAALKAVQSSVARGHGHGRHGGPKRGWPDNFRTSDLTNS